MKAELKTLKCDKECSLNAEGYCQSEMVIKGKSCDRRNNEGSVKITKIQPKKEDKLKPTLKIIDKVITLKGSYGVYKVDSTGVEITSEDTKFFDVKSIEEYRKNKIQEVNEKIAEIKEAMSFR